jgi:hypothetical protein
MHERAPVINLFDVLFILHLLIGTFLVPLACFRSSGPFHVLLFRWASLDQQALACSAQLVFVSKPFGGASSLTSPDKVSSVYDGVA